MAKDILIETDHGRCRMAVLDDGRLSEIYVEQMESGKCQGQIYLGRVTNVLPGMQAAFVDIGQAKNAFLFEGDIPVEVDRDAAPRPASRKMKTGDEMIVQVVKDPGGEKGPRISCHITLPGRYLVLLPTVNYVGVSHKIEDETERERLRDIALRCKAEGMGLIVRTAAMGAAEEELKRDAVRLGMLWETLSKRAAYTKAPALLYRDENLACRAVRDMLGEDVRSLVIDDEKLYRQAKTAAEAFAAEYADRICLYQEKMPLLAARQVSAQLESTLDRRVWLKSGGYIIIDPTEALTAIDVNTGKFVGKSNLSETVFQINCEAAEEIARQLRLRDIGGIIVIDFIDMDLSEQKEVLLEKLRTFLKSDPSKTHVVGMTALGLVEMTRKRAQKTIRTQVTRPCPVCRGEGVMMNEDTQAHDALLLLRAAAARTEAEAYIVEAPRGAVDRMLAMGGVDGVNGYVKIGAKVSVTPCMKKDVPKDARRLEAP